MRSQLTEVRAAQDLVAKDLARLLAELRTFDARSADTDGALRESSVELARLRARLDAAEAEMRQAKSAASTRSAVKVVPAPPPVAPPAALPVPTKDDRRAAASDEPAEQAFAAALNTFRAREHGQAVLDFLDFLAAHPAHALAPRAQYWIGQAYFEQRDYRHALVEFHRVVVMAPASEAAADALLRIGMCHARLRETAPAMAAWERLVREHAASDAAVDARALLRAGPARQP